MNREGAYTQTPNKLFNDTDILAEVMYKCERCPTCSSTMELNGSSLEAVMSVMEEDEYGKISTIVSWVVVSLFALLNFGVIASLVIKQRSKSFLSVQGSYFLYVQKSKEIKRSLNVTGETHT